MRFLIDGYNVMHAAGRMNRRFGPDGLRRARLRFLNELSIRLGPDHAAQTTIVFDASTLPLNQAPESSHKGIKVIYAIDEDDADTRIELLIARDSAPRSLTVVSTDRRIRRAAGRRKAAAMTSDDFLDTLETLRQRRSSRNPAAGPVEEGDRIAMPTAGEVDAWVREFGDLAEDPELDESLRPAPPDWTEADLEQVAREVEAEFRDVVRTLPPRSRRF